MAKNSIKNVLKNADIHKVFELFGKKIGNEKTLTIQHNIINALQSEHKITIALDDFTQDKVNLSKRDFVKFIEVFLSELHAPTEQNAKIGILFEQVDELSNAKNIEEIERLLYGILSKEEFSKIDNENAYDRTIDLYLLFPEHFKNLHYTFEAKNASGKLWQERKGIEVCEKNINLFTTKDALKKAITAVTETLGKGNFCEVETFECGLEKWFVVSIEGGLHTEGVIEGGKKDYISYKPEEHIVFVFNEKDERLQTLANFSEKQVLQFEKAFGDAVLNVDISKYIKKNDAFNIAEVYKRILQNGALNLNITNSQIKSIYAKQIKLEHNANGSKITLSNNKIEKDGDIFKELQRYKLTTQNQNNEMIGEEYAVQSIGFNVHYKPEGYKKTIKKPFSIDSKGKTNLDMNHIGKTVREVLIANKI
jgi:hypothetical protein